MLEASLNWTMANRVEETTLREELESKLQDQLAKANPSQKAQLRLRIRWKL